MSVFGKGREVLLNLSSGIRVFLIGFHLDFLTVIGKTLLVIFVCELFKMRFIVMFQNSVKYVCCKKFGKYRIV